MRSVELFKGLLIMGAVALIAAGTWSCNSKETKEEETKEEMTEAAEPTEVTEVVWIIDEHSVNDIPVTSMSPASHHHHRHQAAKKEETAAKEPTRTQPKEEKSSKMVSEDDYLVHSHEDFHQAITAMDYLPVPARHVETLAIPVSETHTVTGFSKKGKEVGQLEVISSGPDNEIEQIIFTDKKHHDVYNVRVGMTGKEARKLRRELRHMVHKSKVFLYDDKSNIMYLTDIDPSDKEEITDAHIETAEVKAIIWKDKKHHKKHKHKHKHKKDKDS